MKKKNNFTYAEMIDRVINKTCVDKTSVTNMLRFKSPTHILMKYKPHQIK